MAYLPAVCILFFVYLEAAGAQPKPIELGSSLSPQTQNNHWKSSSGRFAFGFYPQGSGFAVGIWLEGGDGGSEKTIVWTANRDDPPLSSNATMELSTDGLLLLLAEQREPKAIASTPNVVHYASMHDSGNFVLYNKDSSVVWESFSNPTDTLLGGQKMPSGRHLVSSWSSNNYSTGRFQLAMQDDGNLVLYPNTMNTGENAYWSSNTFTSSLNELYLNNSGSLVLENDDDDELYFIYESSASSDYNTGYAVLYRATLDVDGNFRLYTHTFDQKGYSKKFVIWNALANVCVVKSFCGLNSYCTLNDGKPSCICLPDHNFTDLRQRNDGCERNIFKRKCERGKENASFYEMAMVENLSADDHPYSRETTSKEACKTSCLEDCNCRAVFINLNSSSPSSESGQCDKHNLPLKFVRRDNGSSRTSAFFKVGIESIKVKGNDVKTPISEQAVTRNKSWILILLMCIGFITYSCLALAVSGIFIFKLRLMKYRKLLEFGTLGLTEEFTLRPYSYKELVRATNGFIEELGRGSFGAVYRGSLRSGKKLIAVKRLEKVMEEGEREFRAEMRVIGRTHHRNLVRLLGYCAEGRKRLLIYEYMSNGSLADILFGAARRPDWNERVRIAIDVARGILYLHEECETPIIHCDIKPQNILMDDFWTAKISDFGLAKLLMPDQTRTFTGVRGTRGYLAPEWQKNTPISVKVDVYSYGIVLLEIVCCRRNIEVNVPKPEEILLSSWAYECFTGGKLDKLVGGEAVDKKTMDRMIKLALWCIQDEPPLRPSMKSVMLMLEGITDISIPPCPTAATSP